MITAHLAHVVELTNQQQPDLVAVAPPYGLKYPVGCYQVGDMWLYTNRGLGESSVQVRINCRPEITVFTLKASGCVEQR